MLRVQVRIIAQGVGGKGQLQGHIQEESSGLVCGAVDERNCKGVRHVRTVSFIHSLILKILKLTVCCSKVLF